MKNQAPTRNKRNKATMAVLLLVVAMLWLIGWNLYWIGSNKTRSNPKKRNSSKGLIFTLLTPEQIYAR